ncbi:MAG TPA: response regulator transcription factor [Bryobacteraceae bacterium]|nr:response regulator transcription factor [Bryobacteraceae bacterium]
MGSIPVPAIPLLVVDDHQMFREGLARVIEKEPDLKLVGQCASASEALAALKGTGATVVLLDVDLGSERALDFVTQARRQGFDGKVLIVTAGISDQEAVQLVQAGVSGILHKHHSTHLLCETIRKISAGEVCLENAYLGPLFRSVDRSRTPNRPKLTDRDKIVLRLIFQGLTNREIADRLEISEGAVKASLRQVFGKLKVRTRAQLVKVALEQYRDQL